MHRGRCLGTAGFLSRLLDFEWRAAVDTTRVLAMLVSDLYLPGGPTEIKQMRWKGSLCLNFKARHILSFVFNLTFPLAIVPILEQSTYYSLNTAGDAIFHCKATTARIMSTAKNVKRHTFPDIPCRVCATSPRILVEVRHFLIH